VIATFVNNLMIGIIYVFSTKQRLQNHEKDMKRSHNKELKLEPETSVHSSALWLKRKGFKSTSSFLRGQQLLHASKRHWLSSGPELAGWYSNISITYFSSVFSVDVWLIILSDSLVDKHDFNELLDGTVIFPPLAWIDYMPQCLVIMSGILDGINREHRLVDLLLVQHISFKETEMRLSCNCL